MNNANFERNVKNPVAEAQVDELLATYRTACPEREASANFMPKLWQQIEQRRRSEAWMLRWANAFAAAAATVAIVAGTIYYQTPGPLPQHAYIEKLTDEISEDHFLETTYSSAQMRPAAYSSGEALER
jgi:anti-sigma-K factor RskA